MIIDGCPKTNPEPYRNLLRSLTGPGRSDFDEVVGLLPVSLAQGEPLV